MTGGLRLQRGDAPHSAFRYDSAANVDFFVRFDLPRAKDNWLLDPRIPAALQVAGDMYTGNQFDRGHLTRREDMEYGRTRAIALATAADTCHWTNCTPQHARFNENSELWQGIERHLLEDAVQPLQFRAQVITGPVLAEDDPVLKGFPAAPYPLRYWKVAAAVNASGKLIATAYVLDQRGAVDRYGERTAPEVPFKPYKTFQTTIEEVQTLTGLSFTGTRGNRRVPLSDFDPLEKRPKSRGLKPGGQYVELQKLSDVISQ